MNEEQPGLPAPGRMLSPLKGIRVLAAPLKHGAGRRERLPHIRTGESACPTFVSWKFVGLRLYKSLRIFTPTVQNL